MRNMCMGKTMAAKSMLDGTSRESQALGMLLVCGILMAFSHRAIIDGYSVLLQPKMVQTTGTIVAIVPVRQAATRNEGVWLCIMAGSYTFEVDGKSYTGTSFSSATHSATWLESDAKRIARDLPCGTAVPVRYAISNPQDCYADIGTGGHGSGAGIAGVSAIVFTAAAGLFVCFVVKAVAERRSERRMRGVAVSLRFPD